MISIVPVPAVSGSSALLITVWRGGRSAVRDPALFWLIPDHYLRPLHAGPHWKALLRKIGLPTECPTLPAVEGDHRMWPTPRPTLSRA